ncbi:hypothetical protein ACFSCV_15735 [Methylopila henanensis]|uniref:Uncharacterized protein n=1 Tax=Methylopila henanensis TaxID=873516 RepID=A0ABW4K8G3_9HYPH
MRIFARDHPRRAWRVGDAAAPRHDHEGFASQEERELYKAFAWNRLHEGQKALDRRRR